MRNAKRFAPYGTSSFYRLILKGDLQAPKWFGIFAQLLFPLLESFANLLNSGVRQRCFLFLSSRTGHF